MGLVIWIFVVIVFLATVGMFVGFWVYDSKFAQAAENNLLRPFAAHQGEQVLKGDGSLQMSCPAGKKITVIGAVYEVYDPALECTNKPITTSGTPNPICGPMSATTSKDQLSGVGGVGNAEFAT